MKKPKTAENNSKTSSKKSFDFVKLLNQMQKDIQHTREMIPSEINLNQGDYKTLQQVGVGRWAFVETALNMMAEHPNLLPLDHTKDEIIEYKEMLHLIKEVGQTLDLLNHSFNDLKTIKTNQCFKLASHAYNLAKLQSKSNADDALAIYHQLKNLLPKRKKDRKERKKSFYNLED